MSNFFRKVERQVSGFVSGKGSTWNDTGPSQSIQQWQGADLNNLQFDQSGFPVGFNGPPNAGNALQVQYQGERATAQRRNQYFSDAIGALNSGTHLMASYRPGGAAALRSGIFNQQANLLYNIGGAQQTPDFLSDFRRDAQAQADIQAGRAANWNKIMGVAQLAANIAGGHAGAVPPVQQPTPGLAAQSSQGLVSPGSYVPQGSGQMFPETMNAQLGPEQGPESGQVIGGPGQALGGGQQTLPSSLAPSGAAAGGSGGGGESSPASASAGAPGSAGRGPSPVGGGYGQDGNFTPTALASSNARTNPALEPITTQLYAANMDTSFWAAADAYVDHHLNNLLGSHA